MSEHQPKVVTRFAPSPTGFVHTGNIHTGLFAWLWARKNNGTFILRIEDTDKKREVEGAIEHLEQSLKWLGIEWDEGLGVGGPHAPYIQSERITELDIYTTYARRLIDSGYAYADSKSEAELEALRAEAEAQKRPFLYREHRPEHPPEWKPGMPLRFKVRELKRTIWQDAVRGELSAGPEASDDFILIKSDGYPTYNFAHIVDDIEMGVTHVTRGQEFISSTPNYIAVYEALGAPQPVYVTVPHIMGDGGKKKLGKRDGAKDVLQYEKEGYLPDAMVNFLALMGWNPGGEEEIFNRQEIIAAFDIAKIQKSGAQFNEEKLDWMNKEHMKRLPEVLRNEEILKRLRALPEIGGSAALDDLNFLSRLYPIIFDRISKWGDIDALGREGELSYFFSDPVFDLQLLLWKDESREEAHEYIAYVRDAIEQASPAVFENPESLKALIFDYATEKGRGKVLWPVRVSLSGKEKSPDPFTLMYILGRVDTLKRLEKAAASLG